MAERAMITPCRCPAGSRGGKGLCDDCPERDMVPWVTDERRLQRRIVDLTFGYANEDQSVPSTKTADRIIDQAIKESML